MSDILLPQPTWQHPSSKNINELYLWQLAQDFELSVYWKVKYDEYNQILMLLQILNYILENVWIYNTKKTWKIVRLGEIWIRKIIL